MKEPGPLPPLEEFIARSPLYLPFDLTKRRQEEGAAAAETTREASRAAGPLRIVEGEPVYRQASSREVLQALTNAKLEEIWNYAGTFDAFCPPCKDRSTFTGVSPRDCSQPVGSDTLPDGRYNYKHFVCSREPSDHAIRVALRYDPEALTIMKVGQYPSLADLASGELFKYTVFKGYYPQLHRAVGLKAHGIGIGSFVYLRRVFEGLLEEARVLAAAGQNWDEETYKLSRVEERILLLREHLPEVMVENRAVYSILSKGIHELTEEECLLHFDIVNAGIQLILDAKLVELERTAKEKRVRDAIAEAKRVLADREGKGA